MNKPSKLLSDPENEIVFEAIGRRAVTLATAVVQVYECAAGQNRWTKKVVGVACFTKVCIAN